MKLKSENPVRQTSAGEIAVGAEFTFLSAGVKIVGMRINNPDSVLLRFVVFSDSGVTLWQVSPNFQFTDVVFVNVTVSVEAK